MAPKRRPSSPSTSNKPRKRARVPENEVIEVSDNEEDDLTRQSEESETMASKRRPRSPSTNKARKRARVPEKDVIDIPDNEEDDLEEILALIKQSEESERLAKELNGSTSHASNGIEDDAAMARRLASEWAKEESQEDEPSSTKAPSKTISVDSCNDEVPPDAKLEEFRSFFTAERMCSKCGETVKSPRGFVVFSPTSTPALSPSLGMLLHAPCSACGTNHCRGCFSPLECSTSCKGGAKSKKCSVESCCAGVRAIAVFECLGGFDRLFLGERASAESRSSELAKQQRTKSSTVGPGGTGYGTGRQTGHGYAPYPQSKGKTPSKKAQLADHWDELLVRAMQTLTQLLPCPYVDDAHDYDLLPHASIGHLISLSQIPELLGSLLRNDSVTDWTARSEVYYAMIALLRRMADCELTVEVLIASRFCLEKSTGLEEWMWGDSYVDLKWERDKEGRLEQAPPLYHYFKKLARQCEAFLAGARAMMESDDERNDTETVQAISLCGDMLAAGDDMDRAMSVLGRVAASDKADGSTSASRGKGKGKARDAAIDLEKEYSQSCEALAFAHVEMDHTQYNFHNLLNQTQSATRPPKNRLHLLKELATMATSLPPGIFVRVDEVRNDAIKVMIAGPEGTPYAGGLFEFDCFMPLEYPATPPLVHLRTTGGGTVRFNPNLYNNGKVCLSLLGTWPGRPEEQWSPFRSTFLQVLVSIQSMILIDAPYFNEPGHGQANPKSRASIQYNLEIERQTCRWGIVEWFQEQNRDGLWKDVIASHFSIRKDRIRKQSVLGVEKLSSPRMLEWNNTNGGIRAYHSPGRRAVDLVAQFDEGIQMVKQWVK
ncbi:hypothetical protein C8F01DRAFT_1225967 [Mycena amicta]|nr:hypothetical protein C8F01DRAFT_1225967 [Mycena amicta]